MAEAQLYYELCRMQNSPSSGITFHECRDKNGQLEFRTKFGRNKTLTFRMFEGFFYSDIYDNRPGKTGRISLGLDEIDSLIQLFLSLEQLKGRFQQHPRTPTPTRRMALTALQPVYDSPQGPSQPVSAQSVHQDRNQWQAREAHFSAEVLADLYMNPNIQDNEGQ